MRYLTGEEILVIHARIVDETGGLHGVRDVNLLESMTERPKMQFGGKNLYETIFKKAAAYFESCAYHHVFIDGNKRTAISIAIRFLFLNGYEFKISNEEMENFVLSAVENKYQLNKMAEWFEKHSKKI
ncbi:MAG: death-on-curing family protein [Parcubacteria group bacterium GW2011_GWA2_45_30]|nr:MAG: death-on-curing family protein [Parcubacteria group bacterium GW2011_GWA2_45_30]